VADEAESAAEAATPAPTGIDRLGPVQRRTLDILRRDGAPIVFDQDFVDDIRDEMRAALDHFASRLETGDELFVSKGRIGSVLDCEVHFLEPDDFAWNAANARGTIAHRAIELMLSWPPRLDPPTPLDLVDEAMNRLAGDTRGIGLWVDSLSPGDEADVRGQTAVRVTQFVENFPPLPKRSRPVTEASVRWPLSGPITLMGKVDLLFGTPEGRESRKVIIDLKTGSPHHRHRQDLAYYALLETLVREVPPRKVATFYLDAADAHADDVNEAMLTSAMRRTLDAVHAMVELRQGGRDPVKRPGGSCRWCPIAADCDEGQAHLATL